MPLKPDVQPPPCPRGTHVFHPHGHARFHDGEKARVKPCNGRFWCVTCRDWYDAAKCKEAA